MCVQMQVLVIYNAKFSAPRDGAARFAEVSSGETYWHVIKFLVNTVE